MSDIKLKGILENNCLLEEDLFKVKLTDKIRIICDDYLKENNIQNTKPILIIYPKDESHGNYAVNISVVSGLLSKDKLEVGEEIAKKIDLPEIKDIKPLSSGYINFILKEEFYINSLKKILEKKDDYGKYNRDLKNKKQIMVEFGQPNTHKAFTVGHIKGAISGLSVCNLLENLGFDVVKTNYYGDIGMHTAKSTWGLMQRGVPKDFENWDAHKRMEYIADAYVFATENFDDNEEAIRKINTDIYKKVDNEATQLYKKIKIWSLIHQEKLFKELGVIYDKQYPESEVFKEAKEIVEKNTGNLFTKSQGAIIYDGEKEGLATWVVETSENNPTYLAKDLALGFQKLRDYPNLFLNLTLTGVEQDDHFKAVVKILETLDSKFENKYFHESFGWLLMDGKKTSSRSGKNIKGTDILEEALEVSKTKIAEIKDYSEKDKEEITRVVALAGLKFLVLSYDFSKNVNYDPKKFADFEGYSGAYILYAYVRAQAILQKSNHLVTGLPNGLEIGEYEEKLLKWLARYPQYAFRAGTEIAPHLMCNYLYELAQRFNAFYANCPVLEASKEEKQLRLALAQGTAQVLKNGLSLLGIETVEKM
ncbi:MAG: arginine--tRNA ligase [Patescibacteria group bacterium]